MERDGAEVAALPRDEPVVVVAVLRPEGRAERDGAGCREAVSLTERDEPQSCPSLLSSLIPAALPSPR